VKRSILGAAAIAASAIASVPVFAASAPSTATVNAVGTPKFVSNRYYQEPFRWNKDSYTVKSGGTITLHNLTGGGQPHTFSIVKEKDLIKTIAEGDKCFAPTGACGKVAAEHQFPEGDGPPKIIRVDGGDGFNKPYDSIVLGPKADKKHATAKVKITAKRGSELYIMCVIHPQMQTEIHVK
jgi:hypothetical protein